MLSEAALTEAAITLSRFMSKSLFQVVLRGQNPKAALSWHENDIKMLPVEELLLLLLPRILLLTLNLMGYGKHASSAISRIFSVTDLRLLQRGS